MNIQTTMNGLNAFWQAGIGAYRLATNGGPIPRPAVGDSRLSQYALCWDAYQGALYDRRFGHYQSYLMQRGLYAKTRMLHGMVEDMVDFYAFHTYPGVIDDQGVPNDVLLEQGIPLICDDTQRAAIKQIWQWSRWGAVSAEWITYGAATGDAFLSIVDDVDAGRVYLETRAPWQVKEIHRDKRGFIEDCAEEYRAWDSEKREQYTYRREMNLDTIKTFRNGSPFDYGGGAVIDNPYGFVPMVYTQHRFSPEIPGKPAFRNWTMLDEVNSIASRLSDYITKQANTPTIFSNAGVITKVQVDTNTASDDERGVNLLQMSADGKVWPLTGNLNLDHAEKRIENMLAELSERNLEVTTYKRLRESGNPSGVAARRLLGDVEARLTGPQRNYDGGQILALRQALAIAGMRQSEGAGGWGRGAQTEQQRQFVAFDLASYERGDLDFGIAPRPLIADTPLDDAQTRLALYQSYAAGDGIGIPVMWQMEQGGMDADDLASLKAAQDEEHADIQTLGDGYPDPTAPPIAKRELNAPEVTSPNA